jgi:RimJ/RimL family protein N-acetyltransferase
MLHRKLLQSERSLFAEHLKRLSKADRSFRFAHAGMSDELIDRYVAGIAADDLIMGCFDDERLVGAVHVAFAEDVAELGISVETEYRTRGFGAELTRRAVRWTRNRRAKRLYTLCQSNNRSMLALAHKLGMTIHHESGTAEAYLPLDPPDFVTVGDEFSSNVDVMVSDWVGMVRSCGSAFLPPQTP